MKKIVALDEESLREFFTRRKWLCWDNGVLRDNEYESLKARDGKFWSKLSPTERDWLGGFMYGWKAGK